MAENVGFLKEHRLLWAILLSLLLHLLLLLLSSRTDALKILPKSSAVNSSETDKRIAFEIVETPKASQTPPDEANLYSDKNSIAKDNNPDTTPEDIPTHAGQSPVKEFNSESSSQQHPLQSMREFIASRHINERLNSRSSQQNTRSRFSREVLLGHTQQSQNGASALPASATYDQQNASAEDFGGLTLNTYAWDYAPYLLELKRKIQNNIYPPPAYTQLGFGGINMLKFRIHPDGRLEGPNLLDTRGEQALVETSRKAIQLSAPFRPLPEDFPEKFLEVTAQFHYISTREF